MWTTKFWKDAGERAIKTVAQTSVALLTADSVLGILDVAWVDLASVAGLAGVVSVLTSIGSAKLSSEGTAQAFVDTYKH